MVRILCQILVKIQIKDAVAVAKILTHNLSRLKSKYPYLKGAIIQSDNAACYKSLLMIITAIYMGRSSGICIERFVFSETQDGKNVCDRNLATKKGIVRCFVDAGKGNITSAMDLYGAFVRIRDKRLDLNFVKDFSHCSIFKGSKERCIGEPICSTDFKITKYSEFGILYDRMGMPLTLIAGIC